MSAGDGKRRVIKSADQDLYIVAGSGKTFSSDQELWDYYVEHRTATSWAHFVETRFMVRSRSVAECPTARHSCNRPQKLAHLGPRYQTIAGCWTPTLLVFLFGRQPQAYVRS